MAAYSGMWRQFAAKGGMGLASEPERARLKLTRLGAHKSLSAHLFFGVSCRKMWRLDFMGFVEFIEVFWRLSPETCHGR